MTEIVRKRGRIARKAEAEKRRKEEAERKAREPKKRGGKKAMVPTDEERAFVGQMAACGIRQADIAAVVRGGITVQTLRRHFADELREAAIKANAKIGNVIFRKAMNGDTTAAIFWAKTRMGWKETRINENHQIGEVTTRIMSPEEWQAQFAEKSKNEGENKKIH